MAKRATVTTKELLIQAPLPTHGTTYAVISHEHVINSTLQMLADNNLEIEKELYRCNQEGEVAQGLYMLKSSLDSEMGMMFAWSNSYDKSMRFKCAIGGNMLISGSTVVAGDISSWGRKHTGSALQEADDTIKEQITNATKYYIQLVQDKAEMKDVEVNERLRAELLGVLLLKEKVLNLEQIGIIKNELQRPTYDYNADKNSLWTLYNHVIFSLKRAHPRTWMDQQKQVHWFLCSEFSIGNYTISKAQKEDLSSGGIELKHNATVDPNQLNLITMIEEIALETERNTIGMIPDAISTPLYVEAPLEKVIPDPDDSISFEL